MVPRDLRQGLSHRATGALVVFAFCLPLFVGLGRTDLGNDEAIYSYAVESILTTGSWLSPRSSPSEHNVLLEKPPLKLWMVAAPIRAGLLPPNEFGFRFWDAVLGSVAFIYVFLIGSRLSGPVCGVVALLVLVALPRLLFDHGLRSNNMEAALLLSYCGGMYHFVRYVAAEGVSRRPHVWAIAALLFLGFMTKFVAVFFLPFTYVVVALLVPQVRRTLIGDWRLWAAAALGVVAAILPWFAYQHVATDGGIWTVIFGEHVYARFTSYTDPTHLQPWDYYFTEILRELRNAHAVPLVGAGLVLLIVETVRRRLLTGVVVLAWMLPLLIISLPSSKLYHYVYPYLPPLALAAGHAVAWLARRARRGFDGLTARYLKNRDAAPPPRVGNALIAIALAAGVLALVTAIDGTVRLHVGEQVIFRNASVARPLIAAVLLIALSGRLAFGLAMAAVLLCSIVVPLPLRAYETNLRALNDTRHPLRSLGQCLAEVSDERRGRGEVVRGTLGLPAGDPAFLHPYFFYLRRAGGWEEWRPGDDATLARALFAAGEERPVAIRGSDYSASLERRPPAGPLPRGVRFGGILVLLPGAYARCTAAAGGGFAPHAE